MDIDQVMKDYENGMSLTALAKQERVSLPALRKLLVEEGVTIRGRGRPKGSKNKPKDDAAEQAQVEAVETVDNAEVEYERKRVIEEAESMGFGG
jgi:hypothetical protein